MKLARFTKQPSERKRYSIDYSDWLDTGETISAVTFLPSPVATGGLEIDASSITPSGTSVVFFANYGVSGTTYTVTVTVTTSGGQIKEDEILFSVRES